MTTIHVFIPCIETELHTGKLKKWTPQELREGSSNKTSLEKYNAYFDPTNLAQMEIERQQKRRDLEQLIHSEFALSPRLRSLYKLKSVLGEGAYGFAMEAVSIRLPSKVCAASI